jgi:hypothetical protein
VFTPVDKFKKLVNLNSTGTQVYKASHISTYAKSLKINIQSLPALPHTKKLVEDLGMKSRYA